MCLQKHFLATVPAKAAASLVKWVGTCKLGFADGAPFQQQGEGDKTKQGEGVPRTTKGNKGKNSIVLHERMRGRLTSLAHLCNPRG